MKISDFLRHGAENALSATTLCSLAETTPRGLRHYIAAGPVSILWTKKVERLC